ncbi:MAG: DUF1587 domain-containing protein, partial [Akkermansiaceae bacterium]|nr:DUF1587 domain-containing protein [Akkermansiaceae bacterium]
MRIHCPVCATAIKATDEHIGLKNRCVGCRTKFVIPASEDAEIEILERGELPEGAGPPAADPPKLIIRTQPPSSAPKVQLVKGPGSGTSKAPVTKVRRPAAPQEPATTNHEESGSGIPITTRLEPAKRKKPVTKVARRTGIPRIPINRARRSSSPTAPAPDEEAGEQPGDASPAGGKTEPRTGGQSEQPRPRKLIAPATASPEREERKEQEARSLKTGPGRAAAPRKAVPATGKTAPASGTGSYLDLKVNRTQKNAKGVLTAIAVGGLCLVVAIVLFSGTGGKEDREDERLAGPGAFDPVEEDVPPEAAAQPGGEAEESSDSGPVEPAVVNQWEDVIHPLLDRYCLDCHDEANEEGGIEMERFSSEKLALKEPELWEKAAALVKMGSMPPRDRFNLPSDEERRQFLGWVESVGERWDAGEFGRDPGRTTIRRLTKNEYNYTMRDLFGLKIRPADNFPEDGGGEDGFDNNADALFLPPLLMENYVEAAGHLVNAIYRNQETYRRYLFAFPHSSGGLEAAANKVLSHWAPLIYRRPVEAGEIYNLVNLVRFQVEKKKKEYREAMKMPLLAMLISPHFLYRSEKIQPGGKPYQVTEVDLASRLSYFLWSSTPDQELLRLATEGRLSDPEVYE